MRKTIKKRKNNFEKKELKFNRAIRCPIVQVIDENGALAGIMKIEEALRFTEERGYDLVEVAPKSNPPVVKLMDYGEYKYKREKQEQKNRISKKKIDTKGIRLSLRISKHDLELRKNKAKEFLEEGNKIKIELMLKGRERQYRSMAEGIIANFIKELGDNISVERQLQSQGGVLTAVVGKN